MAYLACLLSIGKRGTIDLFGWFGGRALSVALAAVMAQWIMTLPTIIRGASVSLIRCLISVALQGYWYCLLGKSPRFYPSLAGMFGVFVVWLWPCWRPVYWPLSQESFQVVDTGFFVPDVFGVLVVLMSRALVIGLCWQRARLSFWLPRSRISSVENTVSKMSLFRSFIVKNAFDASGYYFICLTCWKHLPGGLPNVPDDHGGVESRNLYFLLRTARNNCPRIYALGGNVKAASYRVLIQNALTFLDLCQWWACLAALAGFDLCRHAS